MDMEKMLLNEKTEQDHENFNQTDKVHKDKLIKTSIGNRVTRSMKKLISAEDQLNCIVYLHSHQNNTWTGLYFITMNAQN